ncbi:MAG: integrase core domain-containing protein [Candidatus Binatia bacterium]
MTLHADNGTPVKGATLLATLERLGIAPSFSRPRVSDDNPYSESLFKTLKYRPSYPETAFSGIEQAREWVSRFAKWYNTEHLHGQCGRSAVVLADGDRFFFRAGLLPGKWCQRFMPGRSKRFIRRG